MGQMRQDERGRDFPHAVETSDVVVRPQQLRKSPGRLIRSSAVIQGDQIVVSLIRQLIWVRTSPPYFKCFRGRPEIVRSLTAQSLVQHQQLTAWRRHCADSGGAASRILAVKPPGARPCGSLISHPLADKVLCHSGDTVSRILFGQRRSNNCADGVRTIRLALRSLMATEVTATKAPGRPVPTAGSRVSAGGLRAFVAVTYGNHEINPEVGAARTSHHEWWACLFGKPPKDGCTPAAGGAGPGPFRVLSRRQTGPFMAGEPGAADSGFFSWFPSVAGHRGEAGE
jgi:hypothetical protein